MIGGTRSIGQIGRDIVNPNLEAVKVLNLEPSAFIRHYYKLLPQFGALGLQCLHLRTGHNRLLLVDQILKSNVDRLSQRLAVINIKTKITLLQRQIYE